MIFQALNKIETNRYSVPYKVKFSNSLFLHEFINKAFTFAWDMAFTPEGHHRRNRSGGSHLRNDNETFADTFQGKLGEFGVYASLMKDGILIPTPDLSISGVGIYDDCDFQYQEYKIAVKSAAHFANLLLLETKDWDENANYLHATSKTHPFYDFFIFIRIKPSLKGLMATKGWLGDEVRARSELIDIIRSNEWFYDIPGYITLDDFKDMIRLKHILNKDAFLNWTKMDAENYYIQTGNMRPFVTILDLFK